ncbi:THUMP domain-containing class I SAM-dependent RNA methyltransferase [Vulgatibacter incomptus]|uniref:23S rRNA (Guanine-N-2-)-methyltransferase rlmL n=1 Tax=Vulgatibacter incomptus TaxID=1391653 RepID=A0A0K1PIC0_9BACT|nr:RNA methyltransferase [Vulgatibacter incomptus]AKU93247.1 23S rRNA (guanine-N-2-) -methyltransferase rlmL [Vulgatibacter incomptus]
MRALFIVTPPGLEGPCVHEARTLGADDVREVVGGVECRGDPAAILRLNLGLRTGSRILLRLGEGRLADLGGLAASVDWRSFMRPSGTVAIEVAGGGSRPGALERQVREEVLRQVPAARFVSAEAEQSVHLRLSQGTLTLSLDTTGPHLHMRGYRQETGAAPLRENLAAGILLLAGYDGSQALVDPMCGSGTFLIEAATIALRRAPGSLRTFACEGWPSTPEGLGAQVRQELRALERSAPAPIVGSDRNAGALGVARRNATRAEVFDSITLGRVDVADAAPPPGPRGILVANPPYGKRLGEARELGSLYRGFGERLRSAFGGWTVAILVADPALGAALRLREPRAIPLRNGGIPCTLLLAEI